MTKQIQIEIRSVYGNEKAYPVCAAAKTFADIAGTTTLTNHNLRCILALGYTVQVLDRYGQVSREFSAASGARALMAA